MQNKNTSNYNPTPLPQLSPASSSPLLSTCSNLYARARTTGRAEETWDMVSTSSHLQSNGERLLKSNNRYTWVAHRCAEGNQCSSCQFKRHSRALTSSPLLCYWEVFSLFKSLCCCWKEKHQAPRQRESKQPAHLTILLSGANSSLGIRQGWGHPGSPFLHMQCVPVIIRITSRVIYSFTKQTATN